MWQALAAADKTRHDLAGADHYLLPTSGGGALPHPRQRFAEVLAAWLEALTVLGVLPAVLDAAAPSRDVFGEHRRRSARRRARARVTKPDDHLDF